MRVYHDLAEVPRHPAGTCVALGVFDGVHLGHRAVLGRAAQVARQNGWQSVALTFHPHPQQVIARTPDPFLILPLEERLRRIATLGLDAALVLRFDEGLRSTEPEAFVCQVLVGSLGARGVVCGPDFRFGRDRRGDPDVLQVLGRQLGFSVEVCPPVVAGGERVSSSRVRALLREGRVQEACELLAHHEVVACVLDSGQVLVVEGRDGVSLPKVPLLPGEAPEQALWRAVREVADVPRQGDVHPLGRLVVPETLEIWLPYRVRPGTGVVVRGPARWAAADGMQLGAPYRRVVAAAERAA